MITDESIRVLFLMNYQNQIIPVILFPSMVQMTSLLRPDASSLRSGRHRTMSLEKIGEVVSQYLNLHLQDGWNLQTIEIVTKFLPGKFFNRVKYVQAKVVFSNKFNASSFFLNSKQKGEMSLSLGGNNISFRVSQNYTTFTGDILVFHLEKLEQEEMKSKSKNSKKGVIQQVDSVLKNLKPGVMKVLQNIANSNKEVKSET